MLNFNHEVFEKGYQAPKESKRKVFDPEIKIPAEFLNGLPMLPDSELTKSRTLRLTKIQRADIQIMKLQHQQSVLDAKMLKAKESLEAARLEPKETVTIDASEFKQMQE